jgi:hypothetical protein
MVARQIDMIIDQVSIPAAVRQGLSNGEQT